MNASARSRFDDPKPVEPHPFQPDAYEPGYRPVCRVCQVPRERHPYYRPPIPAPRKAQ